MRRRWPWAVLLALAAVASVGALLATAGSDKPPDVAAAAQSGDVTAADRASTTRVDRALAEVGAPWLAPLGDEVSDRCFTESPSGDPGQVHCDRTVVRYFGVTGDFADRMNALAAALSRAGWSMDLRPALDHPVGKAGSKRAAQWLAVAWTRGSQPVPPITELGRSHQPHDPVAVYREARPVDQTTVAFRQHQVVVAVGITDRYFGP